MSRPPLRIVFVGWGAIARAAARLLADDPVEIVAIATTDAERPRPDAPPTATRITSPDQLADIDADLVVEAAGRDTVEPWGLATLGAGTDLVVSSVSALADPAVLASLRAAADAGGAQLIIPPGALGGVDALAAASTMPLDRVEHRIVKPPHAWRGTPAEELCDLDGLSDAHMFFEGSASDAAGAFPKNANVAMTTALAGLGPAATRITLIADPSASANRHEVLASGAFGVMAVTMQNNALPDNPKSSALVALSLVRFIRNRIAPIAI